MPTCGIRVHALGKESRVKRTALFQGLLDELCGEPAVPDKQLADAPDDELEFFRDKPSGQWKALSAWLKAHTLLSVPARQIAWTIGDFLQRGKQLTPKQRKAGKSIWEEAQKGGWSSALAAKLDRF